MKRKILFLLVSLLLPLAASAYDVCIDGIYYNVVKKAKQATVTYGDSYTGTYSGDVVIPNTIVFEGVVYNVEVIGERAFNRCEGLHSISIPKSIKKIEHFTGGGSTDGTFFRCPNNLIWNIEDIASWCNVEGAYRYMGNGSEYDARYFRLYVNGEEANNLVIPEGVTTIKSGSFTGFNNITSVKIANSTKTIEGYAFAFCPNLHTLDLGDGVTTIGSLSFQGCYALKELKIPDSVEEIKGEAFEWCSFDVVYFGRGIKKIGMYFPKCTKAYIPDIFLWCSIDFDSESTPLGGTEELYINNEKINELIIPEGITNIPGNAFGGCYAITSIIISNSMTDIEGFSGCKNLESITFGDGVKNVRNGAFKDCTGLKRVNAPSIESWCNIRFGNWDNTSNPLTYAHHLFINDQEITNLVIPNGIKNIGYYQFNHLTSLTSITIPRTVCALADNCFANCTELTDVYCLPVFPPESSSQFSYGDSTFGDQGGYPTNPFTASMIEYATLHVPNMTIDKYQNNHYCEKFGSIVPLKSGDSGYVQPTGNAIEFVDNNVELLCLAYWDINGDYQLTPAEAAAVEDIGCVFKANKDITSFDEFQFFTGLTNKSITTDHFMNCKKLESLVIPEGIETIKLGAFSYGLVSLNRIALPESLNTIEDQAFYSWTGKLLDIYCASFNPPSISYGSFDYNFYHHTTLHVPYISLETYKETDYWKKFESITKLKEGDPYYTVEMDLMFVDINTTSFPDATFREYVSSATIDKDQNGRLSDAEIAAVKTINVNNQDIYDLKGIEFFTALTTLNCRFTKTSAIDVSQNTALTDLDCRNNNFTALDVTKNTALVSLKCARNKITSLDVSKNTKLNLLRCNYNQLTALDVSKCTQLQRLDCFGNKIGKAAMDNLIASLPSTTNGAFYVIDTTLDSEENVCTTSQVAAAKAKGWTVYDYNNNSPVEYAGSTEQELGDLNGDNAVNGTDLVMQTTMILAGQYNAVADMNHDGVVNGTDYVLMVNKILGVSTAPRLLAPASASAGDATLNIEDFTISAGETKEMLIDMNNPSDEITLIQFDLRLPDGLSIATEGGEMLIDIAGRTTWRKHSLNANTLGDVTRFLLSSPTNAVISGTSGAVISITLTASDNFNGGTIQLENQLLVTPSADETKPADYSFTIEGNVPQGISIDEANFPDQKFREYVSGASIDKNQDRRLCDEELAEVTAIDVSNQAISSLKGVEFFTSLTTLKCGKNNLTMLDVSKNTAISYLYCDNNPLSSLDVTNNVALELLSCFNGQLTSLDVSKNTALKYLYCDDNSLKSLDVTKNAALSILSCDDCQLSSLDLSNNPALNALSCNKNLFTSLDVSKNTALTTLYCYINSLTALDVSNNTSLSELYCDNNQLTTLDLSKNTALTTFTCFNNMISESEMDQLVNSLPTVSNGKAYMICTKSPIEENVVNTDQVALAKSKGWTVFDYNGTSSEEYEGSATTGISGIDWDASGKNVPIHTLSGQRLTTPKKGINIIGGKKVVVK